MLQFVMASFAFFFLIDPALTFAEEPDQRETLSDQISQALNAEDHEKAVELLSQFLKLEPKAPRAWYLRGVAHFRTREFQESVEDFDQYVKLAPEAEVRLWERGISHYYAKKYKEGAEQFALYQTYHDNDVENSVWRFLCMVKTGGLEVARKEMLPIRNDPRIPLMEVYALFRNESTPEKVLEVARAGEPSKEELAKRMFYARLYLALYYEAMGDEKKSHQYARDAWKKHEETNGISRYMWQVGRIHALQTKPE